MAGQEPKPEWAIEQIEHVLDVEVRSQLACSDPAEDGGGSTLTAVGEETEAKVVSEFRVALRISDRFADQLTLS